MPSWALYQQLQNAHPLAAWLSVMGPRLHHAGFDCYRINESIDTISKQLENAGMPSLSGQQNGVFSVSTLLEHRFYPATPQKVVFSDGDEHRLCLGGLALTQKQLSDDHERVAEILLPFHARCEMA